jgi:SAM-dependent methyltransferase
MKIGIGCGNDYKEFIGIDKGNYGQQIKRDLRRGLPFSDETVDYILADNILEHIPVNDHFGEDDFAFIMNECLRVLKPGGKMEVITPLWSSEVAYKDPTHCRYFSEKSFMYMTNDNCWDYGYKKGWRNKTVKRSSNGVLTFILIKERNEKN